MDGFVLPLFPVGSLSSSVITTVWVSVFVVCIFNLRFGWVLSGLIVPGYLAPLLIVRPWGAVAIIIESMITYGAVWFLSERLSRWYGVSSLFGRDRFFALLLAGVLVRVLADSWLWPMVDAVLKAHGYPGADLHATLQSFGLVITALTANLFWKSGLLRGLAPLVTTIGATYLIVRYGLMEWTNFTISGLSYMYEDIAISVLASPKSYIILLTTAFLASRMNLVYGWDFNGILLPALLALQWYQPQKILMTFVEAFVILLAASALLRTRWFTGTSVEGARKLLLFFNVGFAWKLLVGFTLPWFMPGIKVTDYFAFGYILSTLLAVKIHDKQILARLTRATLQTSLVAVVLASGIGFGLTLLPQFEALDPGMRPASAGPSIYQGTRTLAEQLRQDKLLLYQARAGISVPPTRQELKHFAKAIALLRQPTALTDVGLQATVAAHLAQANFELLLLQERYFYLREKVPAHGYGIYVLDSKGSSSLLIEAPTAAMEHGTADAAMALFHLFDAAALGLAGSRLSPQGASEIVNSSQSIFQSFHRVLSHRNVLQLRGTHEIAAVHEDWSDEPQSSLWVKNRLPLGLNLGLLDTRLEQQFEASGAFGDIHSHQVPCCHSRACFRCRSS